MATTAISPDHDVVTAEIFVAAPPERVFQAITDPAQLSRWWGHKDIYRVTGGESDLRVGGKWLSEGVSADGTRFRVEGEYLEVDPPRRLVQTWDASYCSTLRTVVYWDLEPQAVHALQTSGPRKSGTGTLVRLRHTGFAGTPKEAISHGEGWKLVLGWLDEYLQTGETVDTRQGSVAVQKPA